MLSTTGVVDFILSLGPSERIRCALEVDETARSVEAAIRGQEVVVSLPAEQAEEWLSTEKVGLEAHVESDGQQVQVLVEKDLGCRHGEGGGDSSEAEADTFDHLRD